MQQHFGFPLPTNLPRPGDDGASDHLEGLRLPHLSLPSTFGGLVDLSTLNAETIVVYCYPITGVPGKPLPEGWDEIPGARGCTQQTLGFQERYGEFLALNTELFGLSTQTTECQCEMSRHLDLPFEILSDNELQFCDALNLPTFEVERMRLLKRLTLIIRGGRIAKAFYPVFPPDENAEQIVRWLQAHPATSILSAA